MRMFLSAFRKLILFGVPLIIGAGSVLTLLSPVPGYGADEEEGSELGIDEKVSEPVTQIAVPSPTVAKKKEEKIDEGPKPKAGLLASTMPRAGFGAGVSTASDAEAAGGQAVGVTGSLSRTQKSWRVSLTNGSKVTYSVSAKVDQVNAQGRVVKSDSVTLTLKAGETASREISASLTSIGGNLYLSGFKKVGGSKSSAPVEASE